MEDQKKEKKKKRVLFEGLGSGWILNRFDTVQL